MLTKSAIRKNYIDKYPSISVPTKVAENASVGAQNQRFLNELHGESVKHGLASGSSIGDSIRAGRTSRLFFGWLASDCWRRL